MVHTVPCRSGHWLWHKTSLDLLTLNTLTLDIMRDLGLETAGAKISFVSSNHRTYHSSNILSRFLHCSSSLTFYQCINRDCRNTTLQDSSKTCKNARYESDDNFFLQFSKYQWHSYSSQDNCWVSSGLFPQTLVLSLQHQATVSTLRLSSFNGEMWKRKLKNAFSFDIFLFKYVYISFPLMLYLSENFKSWNIKGRQS